MGGGVYHDRAQEVWYSITAVSVFNVYFSLSAPLIVWLPMMMYCLRQFINAGIVLAARVAWQLVATRNIDKRGSVQLHTFAFQ